MSSTDKKRQGLSAKEFALILIGSILYGLSTVLFVFPSKLFLGGTSGISVILTSFLPFSPGVISTVLNSSLIVVAFIVLGNGMAVKTLIGSALTTVSIGLSERLFPLEAPLIANPYIAAFVGAAIIAIASGIMFYVDSSSGGTDIAALIVKKFSGIEIGKALLITDILIVIIGGLLYDVPTLLSSTLGFLVKTLGIDLVIRMIKKFTTKTKEKKEVNDNALN
jgi:uncharacterized membrane-anchored protein YitT (DUF2179 family)